MPPNTFWYLEGKVTIQIHVWMQNAASLLRININTPILQVLRALNLLSELTLPP